MALKVSAMPTILCNIWFSRLKYETGVHLDRLHPLLIQVIHPGHLKNPENPGMEELQRTLLSPAIVIRRFSYR